MYTHTYFAKILRKRVFYFLLFSLEKVTTEFKYIQKKDE